MRTLGRLLASMTVLGFVVIVGHGAHAAPQILAAIAPVGGVPLTCTGATCDAEISTYCLQRNRPAPGPGHRYVPAGAGDFVLVVTDTRGVERRLDARDHIGFNEERGFTAVRVVIARSALEDLGAAHARLEVRTGASLVPVPVAGDANPLSAGETADAVGPLRSLGKRVVDGAPEVRTVRTLGAMINVLGPMQRVAKDDFETLWARLGPKADDAHDRAVGRAEFDRCIAGLLSFRTYGFRYCLEAQHDRIIRDLNIDFWNLNIGS